MHIQNNVKQVRTAQDAEFEDSPFMLDGHVYVAVKKQSCKDMHMEFSADPSNLVVAFNLKSQTFRCIACTQPVQLVKAKVVVSD